MTQTAKQHKSNMYQKYTYSMSSCTGYWHVYITF